MKILVFFILLSLAFSAPEEDRVLELPDMGNFTDFALYSGYLQIPNTQRHIHYTLVESESDPASDPLLIWFNGGPGCSSMLGFAQEHGPYHMPDKDPHFYRNPNSWNKEANVLYLESPAGVGFSYYSGSETGEYTDTSSSEDNYAALKVFYEKFPEYVDNDLFISGESYAGIYVPYLAWQIIDNGSLFNLKGIIVGNGVTNYTHDLGGAFVGMGFWHALYDLSLRDEIIKNHCSFANIPEASGGIENEAECEKLEERFDEATDGLNPYDIYRECIHEDSFDRLGSSHINGAHKTFKRGMTAKEYTPWAFEGKNARKHAPPCVYASGPTDYYNRQDVRDALHVETDEVWEVCTGGERIHYHKEERASYWIYPILIENKIRVLHFSGNADGVVPTQGTREWIHSMNLRKTRDYAPIVVEDRQTGGYVEYFDGITFASIQGVGHMAAQWSPVATKKALYRFLKDLPLDDEDDSLLEATE